MEAAKHVPHARPVLDEAVTSALARIAPTWPLDRLIAVNPLWGFVDLPFPEASVRLAALAGARLTAPRAWLRAVHAAGRFGEAEVAQAARSLGVSLRPAEVLAALERRRPEPAVRATVVTVAAALWSGCDGLPGAVVDQVSRTCARHFDRGQASVAPRSADLYTAWLEEACLDPATERGLGLRGFRQAARRLPTSAPALLADGLERLGVPETQWSSYLTALLLDVGGWASWCAGERWRARLEGRDDTSLVDLLAVRLAWEVVLHDLGGEDLAPRWSLAVRSWPVHDAASRAEEDIDQVLQRAFEIGLHGRVVEGLLAAPRAPLQGARLRPRAQLVCCIDVRSEVIRRAFERVAPDAATLGFAGFFGLPVAYAPAGAPDRPHLPGLLAPRFRVVDGGLDDQDVRTRRQRLGRTVAWKRLRSGALTGFAFVEALGPTAAFKLVGDAFGWTRPVPEPARAGLDDAQVQRRAPRIACAMDGSPVSDQARTELAAGILRALGRPEELARVVVLCGHGASTTNNAHAAALDCGACCGQAGDVNARAAAALLGDPAVRAGLAAIGMRVPEDTIFVAALHDTTTDQISLFRDAPLPEGHVAELERLSAELVEAGALARQERASALGLGHLTGDELLRAMRARTRDWACVRPEWGLARNAWLLLAPRRETRHLALDGRAFLHDYDPEADASGAVLELLLTAPMVVAHWINLQYYTSTLDNRRWGSGDKVLHDVVGGGIGVFEGNGGDLRVGLPVQSVHDQGRFVHEPARLGVFVRASCAAIDDLLARHDQVRALVDHGWLVLHQWDGPGGSVRRREGGRWTTLGGGQGAGEAALEGGEA